MFSRFSPLLLAAFCLLPCGCREGDESGPPVEVKRPPPSPGDSDLRIRQILFEIKAGEFDEARELIAAVLADHPGSYRCRFLRAFTWHRERQFEKAREGFEEVLRSGAVFEGSGLVPYYYGWALYHLGRVGEAEVSFREHSSTAPDNAGSWFALGLIALEDHRIAEAESHLVKALGLRRREPKKMRELADTLARLGEVHTLQGHLQLARQDLEEAARIWPRHYNAHYKLYRVLLRLGEKEDAAAALKRHQGLSAAAERRSGS